MEFEDIVYRGYGPHQRKGGGYDSLGVKSQEEYDNALASGWYKTLPQAIEAHDYPERVKVVNKSPEPVKEIKKIEHEETNPVIVKVEDEVVVIEEVPVVEPEPTKVEGMTREELEAKAESLGIRVHHMNSDATLIKKIEEASK